MSSVGSSTLVLKLLLLSLLLTTTVAKEKEEVGEDDSLLWCTAGVAERESCLSRARGRCRSAPSGDSCGGNRKLRCLVSYSEEKGRLCCLQHRCDRQDLNLDDSQVELWEGLLGKQSLQLNEWVPLL